MLRGLIQQALDKSDCPRTGPERARYVHAYVDTLSDGDVTLYTIRYILGKHFKNYVPTAHPAQTTSGVAALPPKTLTETKTMSVTEALAFVKDVRALVHVVAMAYCQRVLAVVDKYGIDAVREAVEVLKPSQDDAG